MDNNPLVSIIMNCYNGEKYLRDAIDSVYKQTYDNWEIILIDNSSIDNTGRIAKSYNKKLKYYRNSKTVDLGIARNMALNKCSGVYIAILDYDDIWLSEKLEKQVKFMEANSNIDVCGSWIELIGNSDGILKLETESEKIKINLLTNRNFAHSAVLMRNSTLEKYGFNYNPDFSVAHDYDLWVRMIKCCSFANLPEPLVKYTIQNNQFS